MDDESSGMIITYDPTEIIEIQVGDLSAPIAAGVEISKLFALAKKNIYDLSQDIERDEDSKKLILPPDLLNWVKEARMLAKEVNEMTKGVQDKANLKKLDIAGKIFADNFKDLTQIEKIKLIKELKNG